MRITKIFLLVSFYICTIQSQVQQEWVKRFSYSSNSEDIANDIAIDNAGNIYVTGNSSNNDISLYTTVKYNPSGQQQWVSYYGSSAYFSGFVNAIGLDNNSNVYITGQSNDRIMTIKYSSTGTQLWARAYVEAGIDSIGFSTGLIVDGSGYIYVIGTFGDIGDMILIKYSPSGNIIWAKKHNGTNNNEDVSYSIALDGKGYIYVAGKSAITINESEWVLLKYKDSGVLQWAKSHPSGEHPDGGPRVVCDQEGNPYLAGSKDTYTTNKDIFIAKYSRLGQLLWEVTCNGTSNYDDNVSSLAVDAAGNIYATGSIYNTGSAADCFTVKYNPLGNLIWSSIYNGAENSNDAGRKVMLDNSENLYVSGITHSYSNSGYDYLLLKYDNQGSLKWSSFYNGPGNNTDMARSMVLDNYGNIYVTGWSSGGATESDFATIKYSQPIGIEPISSEVPNTFSLHQNYPNPFNPATKISFGIPSNVKGEMSNVKLTIFDVLGREIAALVNEQLKAGTYEVNWDASAYPSGVYFYKLAVGDPSTISGHGFTQTKKMVLIK